MQMMNKIKQEIQTRGFVWKGICLPVPCSVCAAPNSGQWT